MATAAAEPAFIDTNVLVYANQRNAVRHEDAVELLKRAEKHETELWISGQVLREYLAAVTRPQGSIAALPMATALERADYFADWFQMDEDGPGVRRRLHAILVHRFHETGPM